MYRCMWRGGAVGCFRLDAVLRASAPSARYARETGLKKNDSRTRRPRVVHPPSTPAGKSRIPDKLASGEVGRALAQTSS